MSSSQKKVTRTKALAMLGVAATIAYATPALLPIGEAKASGASPRFTVQDATTLKECGDCHMAYPAAFLPAGSWNTMMNNLSNHFGEDASLDDATRTHITAYLTSNAGRGDSAILRISDQAWFKGEHRREVSRSAMERAKTWANCQSCHTRAANGDFGD